MVKSFSSPRIRTYQRTRARRLAAVDGERWLVVLATRTRRATVDLPLESGRAVSASKQRRSRAGHQFADREVGCRDAAAAPRRTPTCSAWPARRRRRDIDRRSWRSSRIVGDGAGEVVGVAAVDEEAGLAVVDEASAAHRRRSPPPGMPHAAASSATSPKLSLRLGHEHDIGGPVVGGQDVMRLRLRRSAPARARPSSSTRARMRALSSVALVAARSADDEELGIGTAERGEGPHRHVGALERLDATDEQQHRVRRRRAPMPGGRRRGRRGRRRRARHPGR